MSPASPPSSKPTIAPHLQAYQVPPSSYTSYSTRGHDNDSHLVASAIVIHANRALLLQRAAHGFQPLVWEAPGGRCESRDESVIASAVRELWEESGLVASRVVDLVGEYEWLDQGRPWRKITFLVAVDDELPVVKIDPEEQAGFVWAAEEDVLTDRCGGVELTWTSDEQRRTVLDAFRLFKRRGAVEGL